MQGDGAEGVGNEVAFAEEASGGRNVLEVVELDGCSGEKVFGFGTFVGEALSEGLELNFRK